MKQVKIIDTTLALSERKFSFKEKLEIARQLEKLKVDVIEIPEIENEKTDILFVKTVASFVKNSIISVAAGRNKKSIENAAAALSSAKNARIRIELPVSPVTMEYVTHKKAGKMLEWIKEAVSLAKTFVKDVEFCAVDATRAEDDFLNQAILAAKESGANFFSICDSAAKLFPDDFAKFAEKTAQDTGVSLCVSCDNKNNLAIASALLCIKGSVDCVKTAVDAGVVDLESFVSAIRDCADNYDIATNIKYTELHRITKQIKWISGSSDNIKQVSASFDGEIGLSLVKGNSKEDVFSAVTKLGYDLSAEDLSRVYEEFLRVAEKKEVGAKELDAIVASTALQVPTTYNLKSYVINNGNVISASAQITLEMDGEEMHGICLGDGPIDAAFLAIDKIIGHHYELDDFQIQSVTEGKEAMGSALVKLRSNGKLYSGNGISTDIIGASIRAYLNAVNKIVYEEA